jgi:hypothetical protein
MTHAELRDRIGLTPGLPDYSGPEPSKIVYPPMDCSEKQYIRMLTRKHRRDFWIWFIVAIVSAVAFVGSVWNMMAYFIS